MTMYMMAHTMPPCMRGPVIVCDRKCVTKKAMRGSENVHKAEWDCVRQNLVSVPCDMVAP